MDVKARCPMCAQETLAPAREYQIWVCTNRTSSDFYTFTCRQCGEAVSNRCDPLIERLLASCGVPRRMFTLPDEMDDPQRRNRAPLTADDLLDLINDLGRVA